MSETELRKLTDRISCAPVVDAILRRYDHRTSITGLVTPTPGRVLFGPAATIGFFPMRRDLYDNVANDFGRLFYEAIAETGAGKVLVMSSGGHPQVSLGGGRKLSRLENNGLAGLLCDGLLRDFAGLAGYAFATYCTGEAVRAGVDTVMPFVANVPVNVAGVGIAPGDYVYADSSGAVVIPAGEVSEVLRDAVEVEERDAASVERIRSEDRETVMREGSPKP
jgi:regulator of RNase E activity RraA